MKKLLTFIIFYVRSFVNLFFFIYSLFYRLLICVALLVVCFTGYFMFSYFFFIGIADVAVEWQTGFQDPASRYMDCLIDLHTEIWFYLFVVLAFVGALLFYCTGITRRDLGVFTLFYFPVLMLGCPFKFEYFRRRFFLLEKPCFVQHNSVLEFIWTFVPCIILCLIAAPSFALLYEGSKLTNPSMTLKVTGAQWYWSYEIPYDDGSNYGIWPAKRFDSIMLNEEDLIEGGFRLLDTTTRVWLPHLIEIRLVITSADVLHSFCVPSLGLKMDACPGRSNQVGLYTSRTGYFYGQCSEICGVRHAFMPIVIAVDGDIADWNTWLHKK